jgi:hypothetical protein
VPWGFGCVDRVSSYRCNENILPKQASVAGQTEQRQGDWQGVASSARASHLLAQGRDVPRGLDDPLPAVMVLVELVAEALKHCRVLISRGQGLGRIALGIAPKVSLLA